MEQTTTEVVPVVKNESVFGGIFLGPKELLVMAWKIYVAHFWKIMGMSVIPPLLVGFVVAGIATMIGMNYKTSGLDMLTMTIPMLVGVLLFAIIAPLQAGGLIYLIDGASTGVGIIEAYKKAWKKVLPYWWLVTLEGLIVMGAFVPLIIPGMILSVQLIFTMYILMLEDKGGLDAIVRSREYVKGRWWAVVGRMAYTGLIVLAIVIPLGIVTAIVTGGSKEAEKSLEGILNLVFLPLTPLFSVYGYLVYKNLKEITPAVEAKPTKNVWWYLLAVWGLIGPVVIIGAMVVAAIGSFIRVTTSSGNLLGRLHLISTQSAVQDYFRENDAYPKTIEDMNPDYISETTYEAVKNYGFRIEFDEEGLAHACLTPPDEKETCYYPTEAEEE